MQSFDCRRSAGRREVARRDGLRALRVRTSIREPEDVKLDDLADSDLVLVDLDLQDWPNKPDSAPIAIRPPDGLAATTVFRRHLIERVDASPTGFAILTGQVRKMSEPFAHDNRLHLLADINNLEWIFLKRDRQLTRKVASLARAIRAIPEEWCDGIQSVQEISGALGLDMKVLPLERYYEVVQNCHPPIYELTQWSHGLAFIRWLLQRVLVYPCFLWDSHRLAARLRLDLDELERVLGGTSRLKDRLSKLQYKGFLSDFAGSRWWREAIELFLWKITDGDSQDNRKISAALEKLAQESLRKAAVERPIVCIDRDYKMIDGFSELADVVRVQPDDWPGYADAAFMLIEEVRADNALRALVIPEDRGKLESAAHE